MIEIGLRALMEILKVGFARVAGWLRRVESEPYRPTERPSRSDTDPAVAPEADDAVSRVLLVKEMLWWHTSGFNSRLLEAGTVTISVLPLAKGLAALVEVVGKAALRGGRV